MYYASSNVKDNHFVPYIMNFQYKTSYIFHIKSPLREFLNRTTNILGWIILCCEELSCVFQDFQQHSWPLLTTHHQHLLSCDSQKCIQTLPNICWERGDHNQLYLKTTDMWDFENCHSNICYLFMQSQKFYLDTIKQIGKCIAPHAKC